MAGPSRSYDFLIVGHPRCGTGFMAKVMGKLGYDIGHEKMGDNGTSNWTFAVKNDICFDYTDHPANCYHFDKVIHCVRDPFTAMSSIRFTEICYNANKEGWKYVYQSTIFRHKHLNLPRTALPIEYAVRSFLGWNQIIVNNHPDIIVRIEHVKQDFSLNFPEILDVELPGATNKRNHQTIQKSEWLKVPDNLLNDLERFCKIHGYPSIRKRINEMSS